jgi:hypothetical protein
MTELQSKRLERIKWVIEKGFTYDPETGEVKNKKSATIISRTQSGYIVIAKKEGRNCMLIKAHQFAWYVMHKEITDQIDHINGIRDDNRIINLRSATNQTNHFNETKAKGFHFDKVRNKWKAEIMLNNKNIYLGRFATELQAKEAYLQGKLKYHII